MPSEFDTFAAEFAAPAMVEQFAERDANNNLAKVDYFPPGSVQAVELVGVIVGPLSVESVEAEQGSLVRRETVTVRIPKALNPKLTGLEQKAKFKVHSLAGRTFVPQQIGSADRGPFLDYALERKPLSNFDARTNNGGAV